MNTPSQMGLQMPGQGMNMNMTTNPVKKMPNPSNYKIVKCKNYESGNQFTSFSLVFFKGILLFFF